MGDQPDPNSWSATRRTTSLDIDVVKWYVSLAGAERTNCEVPNGPKLRKHVLSAMCGVSNPTSQARRDQARGG